MIDFPLQAKAKARLDLLTPRQFHVLKLSCYGLTVQDIAGILGLSEFTVHTHRYSGMKRLALNSIAQVAVLYTLAGVVTQWDFTPQPAST